MLRQSIITKPLFIMGVLKVNNPNYQRVCLGIRGEYAGLNRAAQMQQCITPWGKKPLRKVVHAIFCRGFYFIKPLYFS